MCSRSKNWSKCAHLLQKKNVCPHLSLAGKKLLDSGENKSLAGFVNHEDSIFAYSKLVEVKLILLNY